MAAALVAGGAGAWAAAETVTIENAQYRYSIAVPKACRYDEGPGTLDATCSPDLDQAKSADASTAAALVLGVSAEVVAADAGVPPAELAQRYGETEFKAELAEAVCGEADRAKVKVEDVKQVLEETRVVYTAGVGCPEIRFLALGERRARVRFVITPGLRYRLMARALKDDFGQRKEAVDAFFDSFRTLP
jgi:hypothetical protein